MLQERRRTPIITGLKTEEGKQRRVWTEFSNCRWTAEKTPQKHRFLDVDNGLEFVSYTACTVVSLIKCDHT